MLEITKKKMVITRKEHVCHQCNAVIEKGGPAVVLRQRKMTSTCGFIFILNAVRGMHVR